MDADFIRYATARFLANRIRDRFGPVDGGTLPLADHEEERLAMDWTDGLQVWIEELEAVDRERKAAPDLGRRGAVQMVSATSSPQPAGVMIRGHLNGRPVEMTLPAYQEYLARDLGPFDMGRTWREDEL